MSLMDPWYGLTTAKRKRLAQTWAALFRDHILPMIDESAFAHFYSADTGRPNASIRQTIGVLLLKDWHNLTDEEALSALEFDLRWQAALGADPTSAHLCQKTLHNFRVKLMTDDSALLLFISLTSQLLDLLGVQTEQQRLDSTHIRSHFEVRSRLGLFCETIRLVLHALAHHLPTVLAEIPRSLQRRYVRETGKPSPYEDARRSESHRRLGVAARDAYRVHAALRGMEVPPSVQPVAAILTRLLTEQCTVLADPQVPAADDGDADLAPVPMAPLAAHQLSASCLQTPHDPAVTYGHKGQGYEVQLVETMGNGEKPELITYVDVTPSCGSDQTRTTPIVRALIEQGMPPETLVVDTNYASTDNVIACAAHGVEVIGPVGGTAGAPTAAEQLLGAFHVPMAPDEPPAWCPQLVHALRDERDLRPAAAGGTGLVRLTFPAAGCAGCPFAAQCPVVPGPTAETVVLLTTVQEATLAWRRQCEGSAEFSTVYAQRAGCEATNSELKRKHGVGQLRVRGGPRVTLAVYFKVLACNIKRAVTYLVETSCQAVAQAKQEETATSSVLFCVCVRSVACCAIANRFSEHSRVCLEYAA